MGRRYGLRGPWVLRGADLTLPPGTLVRITGGNGTGKSTLLRLVAGIDAPSEGRITGRPARTAYVPERFPAALPFTARGYLRHLGRVQGLGRAEAAARSGEWLDRFGAGAFADTPLAELSKGSSQKVAVAQALLADPALLVLDEAWTGLDTAAREELDRAVRERVAAGAAVVFVDHDPRRLAGEPDAVHTVDAGTVRRVPAPAAVSPALRAPDAEAPDTLGPALRADAGAFRALPGARVRIVVSGTGALPEGLPGSPASAVGPGGTTALTVDAAHSDAVLRTLLTAHPAWHVHDVGTEGARV
ncbi:ATP-binding cassette domain-containing protein [Streptomyces sp. NPDC053755]|uniref:ATP-binding cassette domain-containing protein n=1 Tax=Streptomyces sp. NPDC053755 TaxID=3155815 RepID=UPI003417EDCB